MNKKEQSSTGQRARQHPHSGKYQKKTKPPVTRWVLILLVLVAGISILSLGGLAAKRSSEEKELEKLASMVQETTPPQLQPTETEVPASTERPLSTEPSEPKQKPLLPQYSALYQQNPELFGWICIEDTRLNYPVMHSPQDPEKYLHTDFNGSYSFSGIPFLDAKCSADSDNLLIYGHNMSDGFMFRSLLKYENRDYWKSHPIIHFDTLYEEQDYEVLAAFYDRVYTKQEDVFKFYQFIDAENEEDFDNAVTQFREKSIYDTQVEASYGDQLLTLVTCAYHTDNGRFVVVARRIDP